MFSEDMMSYVYNYMPELAPIEVPLVLVYL